MDWSLVRAVKVFSATKARERESLGEAVTAWIRQEDPDILKVEVTQSSDAEFHCLSLTVFYRPKN